MTLYAFECPECGYDWREAKQFAKEFQRFCGMCAADGGDDVLINRHPATDEERAELARMEQR